MTDRPDMCLENCQLVYPKYANNLRTIHCANVMTWMDQLGVISAIRFVCRTFVTARMDQKHFERPFDVGDITTTEANVYAYGEMSVRVRLRAARKEPRTGETVTAVEFYVVFVAIDEDGKPVVEGSDGAWPTVRLFIRAADRSAGRRLLTKSPPSFGGPWARLPPFLTTLNTGRRSRSGEFAETTRSRQVASSSIRTRARPNGRTPQGF